MPFQPSTISYFKHGSPYYICELEFDNESLKKLLNKRLNDELEELKNFFLIFIIFFGFLLTEIV